MNRLLRPVFSGAALLAFLFACSGALAGETLPEFHLPKHKLVKLANGMTVMLMERHDLPLISLEWMMRSGGTVSEPVGQEGLARMTAAMLRRGAGSRNANQLSEAIDFVGGHLEAGASLEYASGSGEFMAKDLDLGLGLLADMLQKPSFPKAELDKLIKQEVDTIKQSKATPNQVLARYFSRFLFVTHPYARPTSGTEVSLPKLTRSDVAGFHARQYGPQNAILALVGDFSTTAVEPKVRALFEAWKARPAATARLESPAPAREKQALLVEKPDATQTFFMIGNLGLERTNQDWVAVQVVNTLFGGRFTSMINSALRIKSGLTYGARSGFSENVLPGTFAIRSFTQNEKTEQALQMALEVLKKLHQDGITEEQLTSAKRYMQGQFGPEMETNDQLASALCEIQFYGLGADYYDRYFGRINTVTMDDAQRVIEKYYPLANWRMVLIGQGAILEGAAQKLGVRAVKKNIAEAGF